MGNGIPRRARRPVAHGERAADETLTGLRDSQAGVGHARDGGGEGGGCNPWGSKEKSEKAIPGRHGLMATGAVAVAVDTCCTQTRPPTLLRPFKQVAAIRHLFFKKKGEPQKQDFF